MTIKEPAEKGGHNTASEIFSHYSFFHAIHHPFYVLINL
ncbi:hypothetical protein DAQ1742_03867 [Dickeya aquatica]|uniref:Uncharacterized protein n=1 Tax=Dickeya aquatica TaxID=1401087 RepID=A0A375AFF8_9GAMM|nr:hypothetical protein DAQ1742_03867 [Dickeya aquatica]